MLAQPTKKDIKCLVLAGIIAGGSAVLLESTSSASDALDKTDCNSVVLDDSPFAEPVIRDHRDKSYGALSNRAMRPLGGGVGYGQIVPRPATVVHTAAELRAALLRAGFLAAARAKSRSHKSPSTNSAFSSTIYVDDNAEIDLSYCAKTPRRMAASIRVHVPRIVATTRSSSLRTRRSQAGVGAAARAAPSCSRARSPCARSST